MLSDNEKVAPGPYSYNDTIMLICLLSLQHYLTMFGATLAIPLILTPAICIGEDGVGKSEIIGTIFFVSGLVTMLQVTIGSR